MTIADKIWNDKYRFENEADTDATFLRVATALASQELEPQKWTNEFFAIMQDFSFLPAGRIIAGAGTGRAVTLANCYTMGTIPDSMEGIFQSLKEAALTMQQGGGIGYDFSTLRPAGAPVVALGADASGPLSFMDVWNSMCRTVMSAGSRRGAMMATMRCDHPDIEAFIEAKRDPAKLRMFNLSVLITDDFMRAVDLRQQWRLHFENSRGETTVERWVDAAGLWDKIMRATYDVAEPGVIFIDRVNALHNINYLETIATTNPCGEKPMGPYASCILGSINLAKFVRRPFTSEAVFDYKSFSNVTDTAVRLLDNVIDNSNYPLPEQKAKALADRQIGLGITGYADMLAMLRLTYGSHEALDFTKTMMGMLAQNAYAASVRLAAEKGSFPTFFHKKFFADGTFASGINPSIQDEAVSVGIRNSLLLSIAPTGTISLFAGNVSSGCEPIFATAYTRKVLEKDGSHRMEVVEDYAVALYKKLHKQSPIEEMMGLDEPMHLPSYFVTAQDLSPSAHLETQAVIQRYVDSSISKTINLPEDIDFVNFSNVYLDAYKSGCKGCTTYRPNSVTGSILSVEAPAAAPALASPILVPRDPVLSDQTYKLKWPGSPHALYITINDSDGRPFEIFINSKNMEHFAWTVALTRMISAVFRKGGDISFVAEELKSVFDPKGGAWIEGTYIPSVLAAIGGVIEKHLGLAPQVLVEEPIIQDQDKAFRVHCPSCGSTNVHSVSGCLTCTDCGDSKCG